MKTPFLEGPEVGSLVPVGEMDMTQCPLTVTWTPRWIVECGKECEVGITIDDHCFVVLARNWAGDWIPTSHIPREVAERLAQLAADLV